MNANMTIPLLDAHLAVRPDKPAYLCGERVCSYAALAANVNRFAHYLERQGVGPGDRVALSLLDSLAYVYALLGCIRRGALPVIIQSAYKAPDCEALLQRCGARMLFAEPSADTAQARCAQGPTVLLDDARVEALLADCGTEYPAHPVSPDDLAFMFYTSGTTGHPKGIPHRHKDPAQVMDMFPRGVVGITEQDLIFSASKMFHGFGFGNSVLAALTFGATAVLVTPMMSPPLALETIARYSPTVFCGTPTLYSGLVRQLAEPTRLGRLRACVAAGEAMPMAVARGWKEKTGLDIHNGYGATEILFVVMGGRMDLSSQATGPVLPPFEGKIVDERGEETPDGTPGLLLLRGPTVTPFLWDDPEWTQKSIAPGGWWRSGDLFVKEGEQFTCLGRVDDMFKVGGQWVSPVQVESALLSHPEVKACAITARELGGLTLVRAHVALSRELTNGESLETMGRLRRHVLEQLPKYMCPSEIVFCQEIPVTPAGKTQRYKLREQNG